MAFERAFYFLRHGETHWNRDGITQGQLDSHLNGTGRAQARAAAEALSREPIERIVASPLTRALRTAEAVADRLGLPVSCDAGLMECHLGVWQGSPHGGFLRDYFAGTVDPPGGETFPDFCARVSQAMQTAVRRGPNTLIVAHGGLWIAAQTYVQVSPEMPRLQNAMPLHVTPAPEMWRHRRCGQPA